MKTIDKIHDIWSALSTKEKAQLTSYIEHVATIRPQVKQLFQVMTTAKVWPSAGDLASQFNLPAKDISGLCTRLTYKMEDYLLLLRLTGKDKLYKLIELQGFYSQRGLTGCFEQNAAKIKKQLHGRRHSTENDYLLFQHTKMQLIHTKVHDLKKTRELFKKSIMHLDTLYWTERLKFYCEAFNRNYFLNETLPTDDFELFIEALPAYLSGNKLLNIYEQVAILYHKGFHELDTAFFKIKNLVIQDYNQVNWSSEDKRTILHYLLNFCLVLTQKTVSGFAREYLTLIGFMEDKRLLTENDHLPARLFKTCITMAVIADELEWAEQFMDVYEAKLPDDDKETTVYFCRALILFEKDFKAYGAEDFPSLYALRKADDIQHEIGIRKLKLKLLVSSNIKWEVVDDEITRLKLFIKRKDGIIPKAHHTNLSLFIKYLSAFHKTPSKQEAGVLFDKLEAEEGLLQHDKHWFAVQFGHSISEGRNH